MGSDRVQNAFLYGAMSYLILASQNVINIIVYLFNALNPNEHHWTSWGDLKPEGLLRYQLVINIAPVLLLFVMIASLLLAFHREKYKIPYRMLLYTSMLLLSVELVFYILNYDWAYHLHIFLFAMANVVLFLSFYKMAGKTELHRTLLVLFIIRIITVGPVLAKTIVLLNIEEIQANYDIMFMISDAIVSAGTCYALYKMSKKFRQVLNQYNPSVNHIDLYHQVKS